MTANAQERSWVHSLRSPALADLNRRALLSVAVISLAISVLLFAMPLYTLQVYDRVMVSRSVETLVFLSLIVAVALGANALLESIRGRILLRVGNAYSVSLGPKLLDVSIARSARTSNPDSQLLRHLGTVRHFVVSPQGLSTIFDVPLVLLFLAAVYLIHVPLGHAMVFGIAILLALTVITEVMTGSPQRAAVEAAGASQKRIDAVLLSSEAVEAMGMRPAMRDYWFSAQSQSLAQSSLAADRATAVGGVAKWVRMMLNLMVTALAAWYVVHDQITLGAMVAANILAARGLAPLESMITAWRGLVNARIAVERINATLREITSADEGTELPAPTGAISIERLFYSPPGAEISTLKGVSALIPAGSWVGIVGPSGAGKTSIANLLCGVWRPVSGHVRLDGADVHLWPRASFGVHCGYLPQTVELFSGTVRDNIARFQARELVPDNVVVEAAKMAGVHELILRLPAGYETPIGFGGSALSAGQRQRIGLARALLGCPRLLVLDEPNSNLDAEGEAALIVALRKARAQGSTIFLISHRPSLLADADLVGVLVDGQLQHFGSRETVMPKIVPESRRALTEVRHGQG